MNLWLPTDLYFSIKRSDRFYRKPWLFRRHMKPHYSLQTGCCVFAADVTLILDFSQVSWGNR